MNLDEAARVAEACVSSDSTETRYRWEALTTTFPEHDWRTMFRAAIIRCGAGFQEETDTWDSPCQGEQRLIAELRDQIKMLTEQVKSLIKPMSDDDIPF